MYIQILKVYTLMVLFDMNIQSGVINPDRLRGKLAFIVVACFILELSASKLINSIKNR